MKRDTLMKAGVNYDEGVARFAGKPELFEKYLGKLFADDIMETLIRQLEESDLTNAFRTAHNLKGISGNLSMSDLYGAVCELVEMLRAEKGTPDKNLYMPAVQRVKTLYEQAKQGALDAGIIH